eukprot:CAMPEP_0178555828 /NCGR_PEP_ID=MMETSP0697-20121206/9069_1 /TAXON_ID=265572 /ORGANISM="Extubocellulus spinifer, Strain CCMP396" /LENGTH=254 /DNA_ID=CAMNT_0020188859 /DNA_START=141 /DNA_END=901 /DNA_ORIENTATION=+
MLRVTPLYGSHGHHPTSSSIAIPPSSTLVEYGGIKILVNVGWDESLALPQFARLKGKDTDDPSSSNDGGGSGGMVPPESLPDVDAIILTDSTLSSLGGLPLYLGRRGRAAAAAARRRANATSKDSKDDKKGSNKEDNNDDKEDSKQQELPPIPPIYGTYPTLKMGQMTLYDYHATQCLDGRNPGFDLVDVDILFSEAVRFLPLKYSQMLLLPLVLGDGGRDGSGREGREGSTDRYGGGQRDASHPALLGITPHR